MNQSTKNVVCFGEVLWDILPNGPQPGGAPMNVTYHLHQHDINATLITRIGNDKYGTDLKTVFAEKGVDTSHFQIDTIHETGKVNATPDGKGNMTYDIVMPVAWDFISLEELIPGLVQEAGYFIYGSLAARSEMSRKTLLTLLEHGPKKVMDVNLRAPYYTKPILLDLMGKADFIKMNEDELKLIGKWFIDASDSKDVVRQISKDLDVSTMVVTLGASGALLYSNEQFYEHPGYQVEVEDTIGSGDAFLAGILSKLMADVDPAEALDYAVRLGALVATKKGGCPFYELSEVNSITVKN